MPRSRSAVRWRVARLALLAWVGSALAWADPPSPSENGAPPTELPGRAVPTAAHSPAPTRPAPSRAAFTGTSSEPTSPAEERVLRALRAVPEAWRRPFAPVARWALGAGAPLQGLGLAALGVLALFALALRRRPGDLVVAIEYPPELRGAFSVHVARRPPVSETSQSARQSRRRRRSTATDHHMVARETRFRGLRPRAYWIWIDGALQDPRSGRTIDEHSQRQRVEVLSRESARVEFDLRPRGCPVEVRVLWDEQPAPDAAVATRGDPQSIRYARAGMARLDLPPGTHELVIAGGDRVAERSVELSGYQTHEIVVDLADSQHLIFRGCPPAAQSYIQADWESAARALERDGQPAIAHQLRVEIATASSARSGASLGPPSAPSRGGGSSPVPAEPEPEPTPAPTPAPEEPKPEIAPAPPPPSREPHTPRVAPTGLARSGNRYDILEQIGRGGMGVVFKARDKRLGRLVALKQLPENLREHPTAVELFTREARAAAVLNHPNIVTLYDADEVDGVFFITMELLEGASLQYLLQREHRVSPRRCARVGAQVAAGLAYAHERGIVHRDIKTANLFWTRDRCVKIMDFGLAKTMERVRGSTTVLAGTPYYMAPEQAAGESVDARADLYSLGVTLFELLTGSVPFTEGDIAYQHRHVPPPNPMAQVEHLSPDFAELVLQLLAKRPDQRPASAEEVRRQLLAAAG